MAHDRVQKEQLSCEGPWRVDTPQVQPAHGEIISCARAVQEALALVGCEASHEDVRRYLHEQGVEIDTGSIAQLREELKQSQHVCEEE
jgi:hypothetical protein